MVWVLDHNEGNLTRSVNVNSLILMNHEPKRRDFERKIKSSRRSVDWPEDKIKKRAASRQGNKFINAVKGNDTKNTILIFLKVFVLRHISHPR